MDRLGQEAPQEGRVQERRPGEPPLLLIVEDEPSIADMEEMLLQDEGYRTLRAETGRKAEELAHRQHPDAVILDLFLPDKSGVEVLSSLKSSPDTAHIPVIVSSAYTGLLAPGDALRLAEVVPKPFDIDRLLDAVRRAIRAHLSA